MIWSHMIAGQQPEPTMSLKSLRELRFEREVNRLLAMVEERDVRISELEVELQDAQSSAEEELDLALLERRFEGLAEDMERFREDVQREIGGRWDMIMPVVILTLINLLGLAGTYLL